MKKVKKEERQESYPVYIERVDRVYQILKCAKEFQYRHRTFELFLRLLHFDRGDGVTPFRTVDIAEMLRMNVSTANIAVKNLKDLDILEKTGRNENLTLNPRWQNEIKVPESLNIFLFPLRG